MIQSWNQTLDETVEQKMRVLPALAPEQQPADEGQLHAPAAADV